MAVFLYEHNIKAYEKARTMLNDVGKAAIIHPTGTGKSFIGFKLCEDNPDKTICWLSPSRYIFSTQIENLKEAADGYEPENIKLFTYAKLMNMSIDEMKEIRPDYIVLDEFHRCGAAEWGQGVNALLDLYPNVPLLGFSATAIRYLDNHRDMSDELFDGHVASEMLLGEAIVRGILNPPKYVLSIFSYKEALGRYEAKVRTTRNKAVKDKAEEYLEQLRRMIDKAEGLDRIFNKHMTERTGKYIVFCSGYTAMQKAIDKVPEWFHLIDDKPYVYHVYSDDPATSKSFHDFKLNNDNSHLRLLFCIDALNEGVHVENVSGVILLRPTVSPVIYKQQIGRALSASRKTMPVVFDIVNNIQGLYSIDSVKEEMEATLQYMRNEGMNDSVVNETFEVIDEVKNCLGLFRALEDTLSASWDMMYLQAKKYYEENGDLMVPADYMTENGYGLGRWIRSQRASRQNTLRQNAGMTPGSDDYIRGFSPLSEEQIKKLDEIGMLWMPVLKDKWLANYKLAKEYYEANGDLIVPHDYVVHRKDRNGNDEAVKLGIWISSQREKYAKGRLRKDQIKMMESIGMCWDRFDEKWETGFRYARQFYEEKGDINFVPPELEYDGFNLSRWLHTQRNRYKNKKLTEERIKRLNDLGFKWSVHEAFWEKGFAYAARYKEIHGNLNLPKGYECVDGFKLRSWINNQLVRYKKGNLNQYQISKLQSIGL